MELEMITMKNGAKIAGIVASNPANRGTSGFDAELARVTEAAKQAEASGGTKMQAACSSLTPSSKAVLERINAGASNVTKDEWKRLRQELAAAGLMTQDELFYSDPDIVYVGDIADAVTDANGVIGLLGCSATQTDMSPSPSGNFWGIDWSGDPLKYLDQWLKALRKEQEHLNRQFRPDGTSYDTSFYNKQIEANEKVSDLVKSLLELC